MINLKGQATAVVAVIVLAFTALQINAGPCDDLVADNEHYSLTTLANRYVDFRPGAWLHFNHFLLKFYIQRIETTFSV
jgi:hypothetical protein